MQSKQEALDKLARSKFRAGFKLNSEDIAYINEKGLDTIRTHAEAFVLQKLAPAWPKNDGKQTPMRGHPVFKAMHGCACCCRGCLEKWYKVPKGIPLTSNQQKRIVDLLMYWIEKNYKASLVHLRSTDIMRHII